MTRPSIVRADTIDLQDQDAPSAQDHSQNQVPFDSTKSSLGSHQAAEIRHVRQERQSEELSLREAWNETTDSNQAHQEDGFNDSQLHSQHNDTHAEDDDHNTEEKEDGDQSESDDDMMDRMSSSPSIDDGAYHPKQTPSPPAATQWPPRTSSLTPPRGTFNRSALNTPESSPFVHLATHLPLSPHNTEPQHAASPASTTRSQDSSPFLLTPDHLPLFARSGASHSGDVSPLSCKHHHHHHHLYGEYTGQYNQDDQDDQGDQDEGFYEHDDGYSYDDDFAAFSSEEGSDEERSQPSTTLPRSARHPFAQSVANLALLGREDSPDLADIQHLLLPEDDPLLEDGNISETSSVCSDGSSTSWATISDTSTRQNLDIARDDDSDDFSLYSDERFVDSGWGGECLRETEDIDFDFVYALHTFVATVEGQANATKGDTMVLLDDSNSYWWLVRIVKDSSIGYLPAEHIETPTERLARLNKHRNVDLSQAMLGDNMEKSKNPLKKAMRRRNAKTVQFAAPTYVEASDYEYDTEDEDNALLADQFSNGTAVQFEDGTEDEHAEHREGADAEDLKSRMSDSSSSNDTTTDAKPPVEEPLGSPSLVDSTEAAPLKSRKGNLRNADSFLRDEPQEPRRITLTPGILRDEGGENSSSMERARSASLDELEKVTSPPEKVKEDKKKKEKKPGMLSGLFKSKKKDKKGKVEEDEETEKVSGEVSRQISTQTSGQTSQQNSGRTSPIHEKTSPTIDNKRSKLQKIQTTNITPVVAAASPARDSPKLQQQPQQPQQSQQSQQPHQPHQPHQLQQLHQPPQSSQAPKQTQASQAEAEQHRTQFYAELEGSQVAYEAPTGQEDHIRDIQSRQSDRSVDIPAPLQQSSSKIALAAITNRIRSGSNSDEPRRQKVKKAKKRVELDDFDEVDDEDESEHDEDRGERLSESPVEITHGTFMHGTESIHIPTNIATDDESSTQGQRTPEELASEEEDRNVSPNMLDTPTEGLQPEADKRVSETESVFTDDDPTPVPSKPQSPNTPVFQHQPGLPNLQQTPTPAPAHSAPFPPTSRQLDESQHIVTPSVSRAPRRQTSLSSTTSTQPSPFESPVSTTSKDTTISWSNASLRAWLDGGEGNDIRDMLVVIHDKSDVKPVGSDHPLMKGLWDDERVACGNMMAELDNLLGSWMSKRTKKMESRNATPTSVVV